MRKILIASAISLLFLSQANVSIAQWPEYPSSNVPLNVSGEPDLQAPAPRTADGRPDLSGIWDLMRGPSADENSDGASADVPPRAAFFDLGANMEGGLPYLPWALELRDQRVADGMKDNPDANCLPMGHLQLNGHPQPRKIIQLPELIVMLWEGNAGIRQIYMDGRSLPDNDPQPWWYGYSIGYWEGDTLVVETTGFNDKMWLDVNGSPLSEQGKIIERFTRDSFGHMIIDITIEDLTAYSEIFTVRIEHEVMLNTNLIEFVCNENEQSTRYFDP